MQDPNDAEFAGMPRGAITNVAVEYVVPVAEIGPKLVDLVLSHPPRGAAASPRILIVEDESVVPTNLQQSLTEMGYQVIDWVPTGEPKEV